MRESVCYFIIKSSKRTSSWYILGMGGINTPEHVEMILPKQVLKRAVKIWMHYPDGGVRDMLKDQVVDDVDELQEFAFAKMTAQQWGYRKQTVPHHPV